MLAIGVVDCGGAFKKGDVVSIRDQQGSEFARGLSNYAAEDIVQIKGQRTEQIAATLGARGYDEVIHRDNITVTARRDS